MTVAKLIEVLRTMPQDAEVRYLYDGAARGFPDRVWLSNRGEVVLAEHDDPVYYQEDLPREAGADA